MSNYYIVVYDVEVSRVNKIYKVLKKYLFWVQNSVFEGYLEDKLFKRMVKELRKVLNKNKDLLIIYKLRSDRYMERRIFGKEKRKYDFVV